jgi:hypothetical protein
VTKERTTVASAEFSFLMRCASSMMRYCQGRRARAPFSMTATSYVVTQTCQPRSAAVMPGARRAWIVAARSSFSPCSLMTLSDGQNRPNSVILRADMRSAAVERVGESDERAARRAPTSFPSAPAPVPQRRLGHEDEVRPIVAQELMEVRKEGDRLECLAEACARSRRQEVGTFTTEKGA